MLFESLNQWVVPQVKSILIMNISSSLKYFQMATAGSDLRKDVVRCPRYLFPLNSPACDV